MSQRDNKSGYINIIASITSSITCCNSNNKNGVADSPRNEKKEEVIEEIKEKEEKLN